MFQSPNLVNRRGAIFVSVAQSVLSIVLDQISNEIPSLDPEVIISAGATGLRSIVSLDLLPVVLEAYNSVISITKNEHTFLLRPAPHVSSPLFLLTIQCNDHGNRKVYCGVDCF